MTTLCATGHRPNKLGGYTKGATYNLRKLAWEHLKQTKPDKIISGMALGWDMAWAEAGLALGIPVVAALPFESQSKAWPVDSQLRHSNILKKCQEIVVVCEGSYKPYYMQVRNVWMVDNSDSIVAVWDGTSGGTQNCIQYGEKVGKSICNLYEEYLRL